ncbi:3-isopropylmalate/(R)-2-methylmalate dehydratase small subunit [Rhizobiales bacterium GAS191]|jgi:3-isopropylmalate/(R)-2-methylmalate dehydratase small subunit|nr:3-isopropylmalate/(R)-2-methylmalate dehydratase small subunit [Rhizobiales bacterium GAS113]SED68623.1 3-isopropylmalate/(R)-2-methylmalate dehydratase small subunit [Rhizobiales bacterium GAS188]SEE83235.1 3-isopropylmalate/(R)-2-methylmalate dehydratase small subunit [Rhizobiales bacterium GAS191]
MQKFERLDTIACPLPLANLDTDQLLPARFLKRPRAEGYGGFLLHDLRFGADGKGTSRLPLDEPRYRGAQAIVARRNFGSGSSREGAVYALMDFGIRCVIAPSFGDIFASNCVMNGLLVIRLPETEVEELLALPDLLQARPMRIDLEAQRVSCGPVSFAFDIDPLRKTKLLNGWDDIDITLSHAAEIARFTAADAKERPWALPHRPASDLSR